MNGTGLCARRLKRTAPQWHEPSRYITTSDESSDSTTGAGGLQVALEHPVAELDAHREHAAEEAGAAQHVELAQAGQEQLVLHRAVLQARALREPADLHRLVQVGRDRLLAIHVLAGADRLAPAASGASAWSPASKNTRVVLVRRAPRRGWCRSARCRAPCASASIFSALRPIRIGSGITRSPLRQRHAALRRGSRRSSGSDAGSSPCGR